MFYVLTGYNTTLEEDMYRVELLKNLNVDSYIMRYHKNDDLLNKYARYVNNKILYKSINSFDDYLKYINYKKKE